MKGLQYVFEDVASFCNSLVEHIRKEICDSSTANYCHFSVMCYIYIFNIYLHNDTLPRLLNYLFVVHGLLGATNYMDDWLMNSKRSS